MPAERRKPEGHDATNISDAGPAGNAAALAVSHGEMPVDAEPDDRLICAVLAAQVAAIRDRVDTTATLGLFGRTADLLAELAGLVVELSGRLSAADRAAATTDLTERCTAALASETEISGALDDIAFLQAQKDDFARQMANCVVAALEHMGAIKALPAAGRMVPYDLVASYVSEEQRMVHQAVLRQFESDASADTNRQKH